MVDEGRLPPADQFVPSIDTAVALLPDLTATNVPSTNETPVHVPELGKLVDVASNAGVGVEVIFVSIVDPGTRPCLLSNVTSMVAMAPTFNTVPSSN